MQKHKSDIKDMMELMKQREGDTGSPAVQSEYVCLSVVMFTLWIW